VIRWIALVLGLFVGANCNCDDCEDDTGPSDETEADATGGTTGRGVPRIIVLPPAPCPASYAGDRFGVFLAETGTPTSPWLPATGCEDACLLEHLPTIGVAVIGSTGGNLEACAQAVTAAACPEPPPVSLRMASLEPIPREYEWALRPIDEVLNIDCRPSVPDPGPECEPQVRRAYFWAVADPCLPDLTTLYDGGCGTHLPAFSSVHTGSAPISGTASMVVIDAFEKAPLPAASTPPPNWRTTGVTFPLAAAPEPGRPRACLNRYHAKWVACAGAAPGTGAPAPGALVAGFDFMQDDQFPAHEWPEHRLLRALEAVAREIFTPAAVAWAWDGTTTNDCFWSRLGARLGDMALPLVVPGVNGGLTTADNLVTAAAVGPIGPPLDIQTGWDSARVVASREPHVTNTTESYAVGETAGAVSLLLLRCPVLGPETLAALLTLDAAGLPADPPYLNVPTALDALDGDFGATLECPP
jgi:hypothetical protein